MNERARPMQLKAGEKIALIHWMTANPGPCHDLAAAALAAKISAEIGVRVCESSILTYRGHIYPDTIRQRVAAKPAVVGGENNGGKLRAEITAIKSRLDALESFRREFLQ